MHPKALLMKIKTIPVGKAILGPEAFGCIGTGTRPMIAHYPFGWYVGVELDVKDMIVHHCRQSARGMKLAKTFKTGNRLTQFYQTRKAAVKTFRELCSKRFEMNDSLRGGHREAIKMTQSKDPATRIAGVIKAAEYIA